MNELRSTEQKNGSNCLGKCAQFAKITQTPRKIANKRGKCVKNQQKAVRSDENAETNDFTTFRLEKKNATRRHGANFLYGGNWLTALIATGAYFKYGN